jgi:hypothetical protein
MEGLTVLANGCTEPSAKAKITMFECGEKKR